jgi:predicted dehydrogenase
MKLGVLGTDPDLLRLVAAAIADGHEIVWIGDVRSEDATATESLAPGIAFKSGDWELLLDQATAEGVLIGRGNAANELRAEQLKRLAAEARPLLVVHPACDSVLPYYEIDMTRREMGGLVQHYNPIVGHPVFSELSAWVRDGHPEIGAIHQVTCDRRARDNSRETVISLLARDAEPLAVVAGDIRRVSAVGPVKGQGTFASLQTQMTCGAVPSARWSVAGLTGADHDIVMTLIGERGTVALRAFDERGRSQQPGWELATTTSGRRDTRPLEPFDSAHVAIRKFADAAVEDSETRRAASTWENATRAMEVVDAVELSLEKNRTIDVHQQQLTEQMAFRGTMSAIGCGLLLVGFFALVIVTIVGGAENEGRKHLINSWPIILLAVLAVFLLFQFVPLLIVKRAPPTNAKHDDTMS